MGVKCGNYGVIEAVPETFVTNFVQYLVHYFTVLLSVQHVALVCSVLQVGYRIA
jgi:hypothetical protein